MGSRRDSTSGAAQGESKLPTDHFEDVAERATLSFAFGKLVMD
jgi:hypothetical protein